MVYVMVQLVYCVRYKYMQRQRTRDCTRKMNKINILEF